MKINHQFKINKHNIKINHLNCQLWKKQFKKAINNKKKIITNNNILIKWALAFIEQNKMKLEMNSIIIIKKKIGY